ncbi:Fic family protein [archaeon]|jgi:Fic family protein|nr:Fic family protein [archaeon]
MVYLYKKSKGKNSYYYLRASKRKGNKKIEKDIAYLGNSIKEARKRFPEIAKNKQEIKKSYRKINLFLEGEYYKNKIKKLKLKKDIYLNESLIEIEACKLHYEKEFKKLNKLDQKEIINNFSVEFAYNTTSLEGNTITLEEAKKFFEEGKTPANRELREIYDLRNTQKVFSWLIDEKKEITNKLIIEIHKKLLKDIDERIGYRINDIRVFKSHFKASPGIYVSTDMEILLKWYDENKKKLHPFALASIFHHKFEKIHPFSDGNGRTGRMLMNYILIKSNYPPSVIYKKTRNEYLDALSSADKINLTETSEKYKTLIKYLADEIIISYWNLFL